MPVPVLPPTDSPDSFNLRHRHRPWVAHQKLVAISFFGDVAVVLLSLMLAYVIRFETGFREVGVMDSGISVSGYCGHVLLWRRGPDFPSGEFPPPRSAELSRDPPDFLDHRQVLHDLGRGIPRAGLGA